MSSPSTYDHTEPRSSAARFPSRATFEESAAVILPVAVRSHDVLRSGHAQRPARAAARLRAGRAVGRGARRRRPRPRHVHAARARSLGRVDDGRGDGARSQRVAGRAARHRQVPRHARRRALDHLADRRGRGGAAPGLSVLQIDAHADLRDSYLGEKHSHACAMRRTLEYAPLVQVGIRNISEEEVAGAAVAPRRRSSTTGTCATIRDWIDARRRRARRHRSTSRSISTGWIPARCRPWARRSRAACRGVS